MERVSTSAEVCGDIAQRVLTFGHEILGKCSDIRAEIEPIIDPREIAIEEAYKAWAWMNTYGAHAADRYVSGNTETKPDDDRLLQHFQSKFWEAQRNLDEFTVVDRY